MDPDDEFNQFIWDELIDSSSSDDELYYDAAQMIIDDEVNNPGRIGSVEGNEVVQRERLLYHHLLYKDYFSANPTFKAKIFRRRFASVLYFYLSNFNCACMYYSFAKIIVS
jgi:hypothetical protein